MAYRTNDKPPKPENMLPTFSIRNGGTLRLNFNCYYIEKGETHDPHYHDYINWPAPDYHESACQMLPPRDRDPRIPHLHLCADKLEPIDLPACLYDEAIVSYEDQEIAQYLTTKCWIDQVDKKIITMYVTSNIPNFSDKPKIVRFTVFLKRTLPVNAGAENMVTYDVVCHGILNILPGNIVEVE